MMILCTLSKQMASLLVPLRRSDGRAHLQIDARIRAIRNIFISARFSTRNFEPQIYTARCKAAVLCDHGNDSRGRHGQNILCEYPLTSRPRTGSCDEPNQIQTWSRGARPKGPGQADRRGRREKHHVGHHVREGAARAEAGDGSALSP